MKPQNDLWILLDESFRQHSSKACLSYKSECLTYHELGVFVDAITQKLIINSAQNISNACNNPINFLALQLAAIKAGISSYLFPTSQPNVLVYSDDDLSDLRNTSNNTVQINSSARDYDYSFFFNSSGTTRVPQIIENNSVICFSIYKSIRMYEPMQRYLREFNRFLLCNPLFHSFGFSSSMELLLHGKHIFFPESYSIIDIIKTINHQSHSAIDSILSSPFVIQQALKILKGSFVSNIRHIGLGTDRPSKEMLLELFSCNEKLLISNRYGLTELPSAVFVRNYESPREIEEDLYALSNPLPIYKYQFDPIEDNIYELSVISEDDNIKVSTGDCVISSGEKMILTGRKSNFIKHNGIRVNTLLIEELFTKSGLIEDCLLIRENDRLLFKYIPSKIHLGTDHRILRNFWTINISQEYAPDRFIQVDHIKRTSVGKKIRK